MLQNVLEYRSPVVLQSRRALSRSRAKRGHEFLVKGASKRVGQVAQHQHDGVEPMHANAAGLSEVGQLASIIGVASRPHQRCIVQVALACIARIGCLQEAPKLITKRKCVHRIFFVTGENDLKKKEVNMISS